MTVQHERDVDTLSTDVSNLATLPDKNYLCCLIIIIMISCIHVNIIYMLPTAETDTHTDFSAGAVHDTTSSRCHGPGVGLVPCQK